MIQFLDNIETSFITLAKKKKKKIQQRKGLQDT